MTTSTLTRLAFGLTALSAERPDAVAAARPTVRFSTIHDAAGLAALGPEWNELFEASGRPHQGFQSFGWLSRWASLYLDDGTRLAVVTGRHEGRLVLVWPFVIERRFGLRVLSCMGEPLSQYGDGLIAADLDCADADAAFDHLLRLPFDVMSLRRVRDDAALAPVLRRRVGGARNRQEAPVMCLDGVADAADLEKRYCGKLRSSRRRRWRRLQERGPVAVETIHASPEAGRCAALAIDFKREWARRHGVVAPTISDPRFKRFFVAAAEAPAAGSDLRVTTLSSAGEVVGVALSMAGKGRYFGHVLASHPDLDRFGLGGIMVEQTILAALAEGCDHVDMIAPADPYKLEWTDVTVGVGDYVLARTLAGRLYDRLWLRSGRAFAKAAAARIAPVLRRRPAPTRSACDARAA